MMRMLRCLATNIAVQKVAAIVACGVSVWLGSQEDGVRDTETTNRWRCKRVSDLGAFPLEQLQS